MNAMEIMTKHGVEIVKINRRLAIRRFCKQCVGFADGEITKCNGRHLGGWQCPFIEFKTGAGKQDASKRDKSIKDQCRYCYQGSPADCTSRLCPLWPYRTSRTDRTYFVARNIDEAA